MSEKSFVECLENMFQKKEYQEIIDLYEKANTNEHWNIEETYKYIESCFVSRKFKGIDLIIDRKIDELNEISKNSELDHREVELFDLYINSKIDYLLEYDKPINAILTLFKYRKHIIDVAYVKESLDDAYYMLNKNIFLVLVGILVLGASLIILRKKINCDVIYLYDKVANVFYSVLVIFFTVLILEKVFTIKRILKK